MHTSSDILGHPKGLFVCFAGLSEDTSPVKTNFIPRASEPTKNQTPNIRSES